MHVHSQWGALGICCLASGHQPAHPQHLSTAHSLGSQSTIVRRHQTVLHTHRGATGDIKTK